MAAAIQMPTTNQGRLADSLASFSLEIVIALVVPTQKHMGTKIARPAPRRLTGESRYPWWGAEVCTLDMHNTDFIPLVAGCSRLGPLLYK